MPHTPWNYLPSGTRYDAPEDLPARRARLGRDRPAQRHLAQVGYTDLLIGKMIDADEADRPLGPGRWSW